MTRDEAIKMLRSGRDGVRKWNEWREKNEELPQLYNAYFSNIDLSGVNLAKAYLFEANLSGADLRAANFSGADLRKADLEQADLEGANFSRASLIRARLWEAKLAGADLRSANVNNVDFGRAQLNGANLSGAYIFNTHFRETSLEETEFSGAECVNADFCNVDLSVAKGLEAIKHYAPSTIGIDTILRSRGKIPESFLRGCGLSDSLIDYIPSLLGSMSALEFYSCFISHSTKDEEFCRRLHFRLQQEHLRVWYAPERMKGGEKMMDQIDLAIRVHDKLLLVLSEQSMKSDWVAKEIYKARQREKREKRKVLFPIRLCSFEAIEAWRCFEPGSDRDMAVEIRKYFVPDFSNWKSHDDFETGFARLLKDLRATEMVA